VTYRLPAFTDLKWWWTGGIAQLGSRVWLSDPGRDRVIGVPLDRAESSAESISSMTPGGSLGSPGRSV
jgi:hypothetical protein